MHQLEYQWQRTTTEVGSKGGGGVRSTVKKCVVRASLDNGRGCQMWAAGSAQCVPLLAVPVLVSSPAGRARRRRPGGLPGPIATTTAASSLPATSAHRGAELKQGGHCVGVLRGWCAAVHAERQASAHLLLLRGGHSHRLARQRPLQQRHTVRHLAAAGGAAALAGVQARLRQEGGTRRRGGRRWLGGKAASASARLPWGAPAAHSQLPARPVLCCLHATAAPTAWRQLPGGRAHRQGVGALERRRHHPQPPL